MTSMPPVTAENVYAMLDEVLIIAGEYCDDARRAEIVETVLALHTEVYASPTLENDTIEAMDEVVHSICYETGSEEANQSDDEYEQESALDEASNVGSKVNNLGLVGQLTFVAMSTSPDDARRQVREALSLPLPNMNEVPSR